MGHRQSQSQLSLGSLSGEQGTCLCNLPPSNEPRKCPLLPIRVSSASWVGTGLRTFERRNSKFNHRNWVHSSRSNLGAPAENHPIPGSGFLAGQGAQVCQALLGCSAQDRPAPVHTQAQPEQVSPSSTSQQDVAFAVPAPHPPVACPPAPQVGRLDTFCVFILYSGMGAVG